MKFLTRRITTYTAHHFRIDAHYFFTGGFWLTLIQVITVLGALIVSSVFAHVLDEAQYGIYRYIIGLGALLTSFSLTGMGQSIFQTAGLGHRRFYHIGNTKSLLYSIGISITALIGCLYYFYQGNTELALGCLLIALFQPLFNTYQQIFSFLQGERRFKESTLIQGGKTIAVTLVCIISIYITQEIFWLLFVYFASNAGINFLVHILYQPKKEALVDHEVEHRYMSYARNLSVQNIIANVAYRLDSIIVFQQLGALSLAIYTIANILPEQIKGAFKNILTLLVPKYAAHENMESIKKSMLKRSVQSFCAFGVITLLYILFAPFLYQLLFPKYQSSILLSQLIALSFPAMISLIPMSALQAHIKQKELNALNMQVSVIMIITTGVLTTTHGLIGAVVAKILSRYIGLFLSYYHFLKS